MIWEFRVDGRPKPKGSMKCLGGRSHNMVEQVEGSREWKVKIVREIRAQLDIYPVMRGRVVKGFRVGPMRKIGYDIWTPEERPVFVQAEFLFWPNYGTDGEIWPSHRTARPIASDIGDLDKLCRNLGDACEQSGLLKNDSQIAGWRALKAWCVEGESPGVKFRVETL